MKTVKTIMAMTPKESQRCLRLLSTYLKFAPYFVDVLGYEMETFRRMRCAVEPAASSEEVDQALAILNWIVLRLKSLERAEEKLSVQSG